MKRENKPIILGTIALAVIGASGATTAGGGEDLDTPITGKALERASAVALQHAGGGKITETEVEEDGTYEVEITRPDGSEVEVNLDRDFHVIGGVGTENGAEE
ncbi:PepSY domain-containing protein [Actinomadura alba]|uniref:PepSY domain-containing protein n=1 Tax=Actinomadura alba TaxID=406431 RepID=A0ABR7M360_9ACTN|nr:PepSY domain-containing protein [Actinomadura alba]MBC6471254.1 PepSY domain-containing protein [Actinomadura alba]